MREEEQGRRWSFDHPVREGSVTLTTQRNFAPRCEEW